MKYNTKSLDISQNKNSYNIGEKSLNNPQNFFNQKDNYDRDDNDNAIDNDKNKEKIKLLKIIKETKNEIMNKRSKTPENSAFKKVNKKKILLYINIKYFLDIINSNDLNRMSINNSLIVIDKISRRLKLIKVKKTI